MKQMEKPIVKVIKFRSIDIITTSTPTADGSDDKYNDFINVGGGSTINPLLYL